MATSSLDLPAFKLFNPFLLREDPSCLHATLETELVATELAVFPGLQSDRAVSIPDATVGVVVAALDRSPEESSAGGADLSPVVTVSPGHLSAHFTWPNCRCSIPSFSWRLVEDSGESWRHGPPLYQDTRPLLVLHHLELELLVLPGRQEAAHLHQRLQGVEVVFLERGENY